MSEIPTRVFCWGSGAGGALGIDRKGDLRKLACSPIEAPCYSKLPSPARLVAAGHQSSTIVTESGECYTWGGNGELGRRTQKLDDRYTARIVRIRGAVESVSHGKDHCVAITADGCAYGWGDASEGKLGLGKRRRVIGLPKKLPAPKGKHCRLVACGDRHTLVALGGSELWAAGTGDAGQLGTGDTQRPASVPSLISFVVNINSICCGTNHSAAVSSCGELFTFGWGEHGRLGHGDQDMRHAPELVKALTENGHEIQKVSCGAAHTCALTRDGEVFAFGWNMHGQAGAGPDAEENCLLPIQCLQSQIDISCGSYHSGAVSVAGKLHMWGFNEEGQLGLDHERSVHVPTRVEFPHEVNAKYVVSIALGHMHTLCIASDSTPTSILDERERAKAKANAERVLHRFARHILLRLRLRCHRHIAPEPNAPVSSPVSPELVEDKPSEQSDSSYCESDDDFDDENDTKDSPLNGGRLVDDWMQDYYIKEEESKRMSLEDERSKNAAAYWETVEADRKKAEEETRMKWEIRQMKAEDLAGRAQQHQEKKKAMLLKKKQREQRRIEQTARVKARMQREAERMARAREKKLLQRNGKRVAPIRRAGYNVSRQPRQDSRKENRRKQVNITKAPPKKPTSTKNSALLRNRKLRLEERAQKSQAEEETRRRLLKDEEAKRERARELAADKDKQQLSLLDRMMSERKAQKQEELQALEASLGLSKTTTRGKRMVPDRRKKSGFMTEKQWASQAKP